MNRLSHPELVEEPRRLVPGRDEALPLYVQEQGVTIGKKDDRLVVSMKGEALRDVRLLDVSHVVVFGRVQVTTQAVQELCEREIPIAYLSRGAWFYGMTADLAHKNVELRIAQHRCVESERALVIARSLVSGKIQNQRTILRRNLESRDARLLGRLALHSRQARHVAQAATLLGIEGMAAQLCFGVFTGCFRENEDLLPSHLQGLGGRGATEHLTPTPFHPVRTSRRGRATITSASASSPSVRRGDDPHPPRTSPSSRTARPSTLP